MRKFIILIPIVTWFFIPLTVFGNEEIKGFSGIHLGDFFEDQSEKMVSFSIIRKRCYAYVTVHVNDDNLVYSIDVNFQNAQENCNLEVSDIIEAYENKYGKSSRSMFLNKTIDNAVSWGNNKSIFSYRSLFDLALGPIDEKKFKNMVLLQFS
jgi:hypothetical protein